MHSTSGRPQSVFAANWQNCWLPHCDPECDTAQHTKGDEAVSAHQNSFSTLAHAGLLLTGGLDDSLERVGVKEAVRAPGHGVDAGFLAAAHRGDVLKIVLAPLNARDSCAEGHG